MSPVEAGPNFFFCGPDKGTDKPYACICCHEEFDDIDQLAVSLCWECNTGKFDCAACLERGIPFDQFSDKSDSRQMHRFDRWENITEEPWFEDDNRLAVAVCGFSVPNTDVGQGVAVIFDYCKTCWPDDGK